MRFVPAHCLKEGMKVGKNVFGKSGELLLATQVSLTASNIKRIIEMEFNGIYIDDDLTQDIEVVEVISETLRNTCTRTIKKAFISVENGQGLSKECKENITYMVDQIMQEVTTNRDVIVNLIDVRTFDDYTYCHCVNVCVMALLVATSLGWNKKKLYNVGMAAVLHDIGKVFIPKEIINKPGALNEEELKMIKTHPSRGYEYIKNNFDLPATVYISVLQHHERYDGDGYPMEKRGSDILDISRLIAVVDVYDAMVSDRPYRKRVLPSDAIELMMASCKSHFDPEILKAFISKIAPYPSGTMVSLSNGFKGIVIENFSTCPLRPKVRVIQEGETTVEPYEVNLKNDRTYLCVVIDGIEDIETPKTASVIG